jgi:Tol biopolymer transport system component
MILDLETGQMTPVPGVSSIDWNTQLSWSPDGKFLAGTGGHGTGQIVVIDVATGEMKTIAEGRNPSWSPKGDWIAYDWTIIHPDGTGARSILERERKWMSWEVDAPIVWSPDGEKLLLNQQNSDADGSRVIMVDLSTGHAVRIFKNGEVVVSGWVPYSGK